MQLSDLLRMTLENVGQQEVTLQAELDFVSKYLEIEQTRFADRLVVRFDVEPETLDTLVPTLLLQPLVENAIKHGIGQRIEGGTVKVAATVVDGSLRLSVENDMDEDAVQRPGEGVGLQNVRRRLDALAAREARLDTYREDGRFRVTLILPARRSAPAAAAKEVAAHVR
jgi:LytS/YehU family sensor histidine kinase